MVNLDTKSWLMLSISGAGLAVSLVTGGNNFGSISNGREVYQDAKRNQKITEIKEAARIADQEIAEKRYRTCIPYVSGNHKVGFKFPTLHESLTVRDRETNLPLPNGYLVCDAHGGTAIIRDGKPADIKYTGNREAVRSRIARYRGGEYQQPFINNYSQPYTSNENTSSK